MNIYSDGCVASIAAASSQNPPETLLFRLSFAVKTCFAVTLFARQNRNTPKKSSSDQSVLLKYKVQDGQLAQEGANMRNTRLLILCGPTQSFVLLLRCDDDRLRKSSGERALMFRSSAELLYQREGTSIAGAAPPNVASAGSTWPQTSAWKSFIKVCSVKVLVIKFFMK